MCNTTVVHATAPIVKRWRYSMAIQVSNTTDLDYVEKRIDETLERIQIFGDQFDTAKTLSLLNDLKNNIDELESFHKDGDCPECYECSEMQNEISDHEVTIQGLEEENKKLITEVDNLKDQLAKVWRAKEKKNG